MQACGGSGICVHGRQKSKCKGCGGSGICEHGRDKYRCKDCGGSGICEHIRHRSQCKECAIRKLAPGEHAPDCQCKEHAQAPVKSTCAHGLATSACGECKLPPSPPLLASTSVVEKIPCKTCSGTGVCIPACESGRSSPVQPSSAFKTELQTVAASGVNCEPQAEPSSFDAVGEVPQVSSGEADVLQMRTVTDPTLSLQQLCKHGKDKSSCACGGPGPCEHGRRKYKCKDCGGSGVCVHGREKRKCKECGGSAICQHNREKRYCKECGGSAICEHGRQRTFCSPCGGSGICEHGRRKYTCKECLVRLATSGSVPVTGKRNAPFTPVPPPAPAAPPSVDKAGFCVQLISPPAAAADLDKSVHLIKGSRKRKTVAPGVGGLATAVEQQASVKRQRNAGAQASNGGASSPRQLDGDCLR